MIVIGDAAHAPSPTSGQGASLAIEDARRAGQVACATRRRREAAFARFEAARRPRVERIVKWAARINNSKAAGPVGAAVRDAMLPADPQADRGRQGAPADLRPPHRLGRAGAARRPERRRG